MRAYSRYLEFSQISHTTFSTCRTVLQIWYLLRWSSYQYYDRIYFRML